LGIRHAEDDISAVGVCEGTVVLRKFNFARLILSRQAEFEIERLRLGALIAAKLTEQLLVDLVEPSGKYL
jgi:hypothetical protein